MNPLTTAAGTDITHIPLLLLALSALVALAVVGWIWVGLATPAE